MESIIFPKMSKSFLIKEEGSILNAEREPIPFSSPAEYPESFQTNDFTKNTETLGTKLELHVEHLRGSGIYQNGA